MSPQYEARREWFFNSYSEFNGTINKRNYKHWNTFMILKESIVSYKGESPLVKAKVLAFHEKY